MMEVTSLSSFDLDGRTPAFEEPYTVVLGLEAGEGVPEHTHPGKSILFAVQEGQLDLSVGEETHTLAAGDVARFDGEQEISVAATEDSKALVVLTDE
ncbi:MAG: quercetin dioxygenase-like cupin family protein [Haloarculaceae archaeon]|jgi:quercetin dioxygenase-like cupin family protein